MLIVKQHGGSVGNKSEMPATFGLDATQQRLIIFQGKERLSK